MGDTIIRWLDRRAGGTVGVLLVLFIGLAGAFAGTLMIGDALGRPGLLLTPAAARPTDLATAAAAPIPAAVAIPSLEVSSTLVPVGLRPDGTLDVPPVDRPEQAAWWTDAPVPGAPGPAVIVGHVNGDGRPGVFAELATLDAGDRVEVTRADGSLVAFEVTAVEQHDKDSFPHLRVYGDVPGPELRLITCGGVFDAGAGSYQDNVIVWARQVP